jgi:mono/diheme cytochrome c family protein
MVLMNDMKRIYLVLWVGFIFSCGNSDKPPFETKKQTTTDTKETTTSTLSGAELYSQKCTACHGDDGNLGLGGAKKISESTLSQVEREELISNGKKTMPAFKDQISQEEIKKIAEYTLTLK